MKAGRMFSINHFWAPLWKQLQFIVSCSRRYRGAYEDNNHVSAEMLPFSWGWPPIPKGLANGLEGIGAMQLMASEIPLPPGTSYCFL